MQRTERLTHRREGVPAGYWTNKNKPELMQRLGEYEDTELSPAEVKRMKKQKFGNSDEVKFELFLTEVKQSLGDYANNCVKPPDYTSKLCFLAEVLTVTAGNPVELSFTASQIKRVLSLEK